MCWHESRGLQRWCGYHLGRTASLLNPRRLGLFEWRVPWTFVCRKIQWWVSLWLGRLVVLTHWWRGYAWECQEISKSQTHWWMQPRRRLRSRWRTTPRRMSGWSREHFLEQSVQQQRYPRESSCSLKWGRGDSVLSPEINGTGRPANYQERQEFPTGVTLEDFPGTAAEREETRRMFAGYADVFAKDGEGLGCTPTLQHRITTADDIPVAQRHRRIAPNQLSEVKKHLQELLEKGVIKTSQSDYASPIVLVRKKSGALRMCVDYRQLNLKTRRDAYPLSRIEESLDVLGGAKYFSTIDLASAYNQVEVNPADRHKTAFTTPLGLFEYNRMPFGLANAPATFQSLMQHIFREDLLQTLIVYLDDIIVFSQDVKEHLRRLELVFQKLREHGLKIEPKKCQFFCPKVTFLGHVVSADGVATDPEKTEAVTKWPTPRTLKELRSFLGFASYYRRFVPHFAQVAKPLHELVARLYDGGKSGKGRNR